MFDQKNDENDPYRGEGSRWSGLTTYAFTDNQLNESIKNYRFINRFLNNIISINYN